MTILLSIHPRRLSRLSLSGRRTTAALRTDQPHRWARVPAVDMMLVGAGLLISAPGIDTMILLGWVWPPILMALVVWMFVQPRKDLRSRTRVWLVYPVLRVLALAPVGVVDGALLIEAESDAAVAGQAILDAVESVRTGTPLAAA